MSRFRTVYRRLIDGRSTAHLVLDRSDENRREALPPNEAAAIRVFVTPPKPGKKKRELPPPPTPADSAPLPTSVVIDGVRIPINRARDDDPPSYDNRELPDRNRPPDPDSPTDRFPYPPQPDDWLTEPPGLENGEIVLPPDWVGPADAPPWLALAPAVKPDDWWVGKDAIKPPKKPWWKVVTSPWEPGANQPPRGPGPATGHPRPLPGPRVTAGKVWPWWAWVFNPIEANRNASWGSKAARDRELNKVFGKQTKTRKRPRNQTQVQQDWWRKTLPSPVFEPDVTFDPRVEPARVPVAAPARVPEPVYEPVRRGQPMPQPQPFPSGEPYPVPTRAPATAPATVPSGLDWRDFLPFLPLLPLLGDLSQSGRRVRRSPSGQPGLPGTAGRPGTAGLPGDDLVPADFVDYFQSPAGLQLGLAQAYAPAYAGGCPPCDCKPKKRKKGKKSVRSECFSGTYTERANGLTKRKKRKVPCR